MTVLVVVASGPVIDPIEVLRPAASSPQALAASLAGGAAAAGLVAVVALALLAVVDAHRGRPDATAAVPRWLLLLVAGASAAQLALVVLPRPVQELASTLVTRQPGALLARLLLIAVLALVAAQASTDRPALPSVPLAWLRAVTAALTAATIPPATAGVASASDLALVGAVVLVLAVVGALGLAWARRRSAPRSGLAMVLVIVAVAVVPLVTLAQPDPPPPFHAERLAVDGVSLDITIAPVRPGRNEFHLYAWDANEAEVDLSAAEVLLGRGTPPTRFELLRVSPNHHLSYVLELPEPGPWELTIVAQRSTGGSLRATTSIEESP